MLPRMLTVGHGAGVYTLCVLGVFFVLLKNPAALFPESVNP